MAGIQTGESLGPINVAEKFPITFEPFRTASIAGAHQQQLSGPAVRANSLDRQ
jgi:hypothetical protein